MNRISYLVLFFSFLFVVQLSAQTTFPRAAEITVPAGLEEGGFGGIVAGVDFDQDGLPEFYACNTNMVDRPNELVPKIYKFEWNPTTATWDSVWGAVMSDIPLQNTWPGFTTGDLDKDGKPEIIWAPANYLSDPENLNPARIIVFEYPGDGSDNMGVSDGFGGFFPNAKSNLFLGDNVEMRPIRLIIADIDGDNTDEIIFADRRSAPSYTNTADWNFGVVSVSDIPDNGGDLETWTVEANGAGDLNISATGNKWDVAVLNNYIYLFDGELTGGSGVWPVRWNGTAYETLPAQYGIAGGNSSFKAAITYDVDGDNSDEMIVGEWLDATVGQGANVWLLKQDGDTLTSTLIADLEPFGVVRLNSVAAGDLDNDGKVDFVFGSRYEANNTSKVPILRLAYQGGDITNPASWVASLLDSGYWNNNGDMEVYVGNVDGDPADEVFYTQGYTRGNSNDTVMALVLLDPQVTPVSVEKESNLIPSEFYLDQNFPNPFNPSTTIKFGLNKAANVDLRVYDALGSEVAILVSNKYMEGGSYNVKFDASNLASGIYIYRLTTGDVVISKKMQLLK
jgi:hypothetical protein